MIVGAGDGGTVGTPRDCLKGTEEKGTEEKLVVLETAAVSFFIPASRDSSLALTNLSSPMPIAPSKGRTLPSSSQ